MEKRKASITDMTCGSPLKLILAFAIPMLIGTLFQQFYSMVDTVMVGKYLGVNSLAAVGSTGAIFFMVNGFVIGNTAGFAIPVAQKFGAKDYKEMRKFTMNAVYMGIFFSVVLTAVVCLLTKTILIVTNTPAEIMDDAYIYIIIVFAGIPVMYLYNLTASIIRALGDSKTPLYFLVVAALLNIVLDFVSIKFMGLGVAGPAYATVVSQLVSGILCVVYMVKKFDILKLEPGEGALSMSHVKVVLSMGIPMGLQYSITAIGSVILQAAVNGLGAVTVAAVTAGSKISSFCVAVTDALGATMATYCGQNVGAGKLDRVKEGVRVATIIGLIYAALVFIFMIFIGGELPKLFVDTSKSDVISQARLFLLCNSGFYFALIFVNVWRNSIQGMGFPMFAILSGVCEMFARGIVGFVGVKYFGFVAACMGSPLAWIVADMFLIPGFMYCIRRLRKVFAEREPVETLKYE